MNSKGFGTHTKGTSSWGPGEPWTFWNLESRNGISRGFQEVFSTADTMLFCQNTCKTGNNGINTATALFERFTDLNLFKHVFNAIQNWEADAL